MTHIIGISADRDEFAGVRAATFNAGGRVSGFLVARTAERWILEPGERHWDILRGPMRQGQTAGPLIMDAATAAIALEYGAIVCTTDRDFSRFPDLKWTNPLVT